MISKKIITYMVFITAIITFNVSAVTEAAHKLTEEEEAIVAFMKILSDGYVPEKGN